MRRRYVYEASATPATQAGFQIEAFVIHRDRTDLCANSPEDHACAGITRFFHPDGLAWIE